MNFERLRFASERNLNLNLGSSDVERSAAVHDHSHAVAANVDLLLALVHDKVLDIENGHIDLELLSEEGGQIFNRSVQQAVCLDLLDFRGHLLTLVSINGVPVGTGEKIVFASHESGPM